MTVIKTKVLNATNHRSARIKASANGFNVTIPFPYADSYELAHFRAVQALIKKHGLDWDISTMGFGSDNIGYYFTFNNSIVQGA